MKDDGRIPRIKDTDMTDRLLTAGVPRHVLARWQSQCGGISHHTHRGAVQERGWTFDPTHHGTVQGPTGRMAFFIRNGGMMRRSI